MKLFYRETGKGIPVIILHGLYGCSDNWMYISRKLSEKYRVIAVDCRNHGNSPHAQTHTYPEMVTDLAWLFSDLEIEKAHVLGHSMGGKLAMAFAADYPEKIISLTVVDIAPKNYMDSPASEIHYTLHKNILDTLLNLDLKTYTSRKEIENQIKAAISYDFIRGFILKNLKRVGKDFEWKINLKVLRDNLDHILLGVDISDFEDRLPMTNYPVLFIRGGLSDYIKEEDFQLIRKMYPEAIITTIEGTTHYLPTEKPDELIECFVKFLKR